jgi:hypothetical protein
MLQHAMDIGALRHSGRQEASQPTQELKTTFGFSFEKSER